MVKNKFVLNVWKNLSILGVFIVLTIIVFIHRFEHITEAYGMSNVDTDGTLWYYWAQWFYDQNNLYFSSVDLIGFPFEYNVSYILPFYNLIYRGISYLIQFTGTDISSIIFISNISSLIVYPLHAFFTYLLVSYLTQNKFAGFVSGVAGGFSYYFVLMNRGSLSLNHIYLIPIILLFAYRAVREKSLLYTILSGISFTILFAINTYWGFFIAIFIITIVLSELYFVKKLTLNEKIIFLIKYGIIHALLTLIVNWNFFQQYLNTSNKFNENRIINQSTELLRSLDYINPSNNNLLYSFGTGSDFFLGYITIGLSICGFILLRNQKYFISYFIIFINFLFAVLLSTNLTGMSWLNNLYFEYFGMFRVVSRFVIFASIFLAIMIGYVIKYFMEYKFIRSFNRYLVKIFILGLTLIILLEGLNNDPTWNELTFVKPIEETYRTIRDNDEVKVIAQYPMSLTGKEGGFPGNYQLIGQIVHQKKLVAGADPFNQEAVDYYNTIKDIESPETINILRNNKVDTIIINKKFFANGDAIVKKLKKDTRLTYVDKYEGDFSRYINAGKSISHYNEASAYIEVFKINP